MEVAKSLCTRFPERDFIIQFCSFVNLIRRKHQLIDINEIIDRFDNNYFDHNRIERGYHAYRNDDLLDFLFEDKCKAKNEKQTGDSFGFGVTFIKIYQNTRDCLSCQF